jgi:selenocysteine-specific elongation factor
VLRQIAPPDTVGGGEVIDPHPRKHGTLPPAEEATGPAPRQHAERSHAPCPPAPRPALDEAALRLAELLRADGSEPRADGALGDAAGLAPGQAADRLRALERAGQAVRVARNLHYAPAALAELSARIVSLCERDGAVTIAAVRDELGTSRRYAQALLEHLDAEKVTIRRGDEHVLRAPRP